MFAVLEWPLTERYIRIRHLQVLFGILLAQPTLGQEQHARLVLEILAQHRAAEIAVPVAFAIGKFHDEHLCDGPPLEPVARRIDDLQHLGGIARRIATTVALRVRTETAVSRDMAQSHGEFLVGQPALKASRT